MAAEIKQKVTLQPDVWESSKDNWEYVAIPEENALGYKHDDMGLNDRTFEAGKTYLVPPAIAATLKDRLKVYARACVRTLQPKRDVTSENQVSVGTTNRGTPVDAATLQ